MRRAPRPVSDTANRVLDVAERLVQAQGFNGFSYADVSTELGITKASLHYHFPTKAILGRALIERYQATFSALLGRIDREPGGALKKLNSYVGLYAAVLRNQRLCLCGMLAAEFGTLPKAMRDGVTAFFDANERWLAGVLEAGRASDELLFEGSAVDAARMLLGAFEGAMLVARSYGDPERFTASATCAVSQLAARSYRT